MLTIRGSDTVTREDPDFGRNTTNKFALQYQLNDDIMLYTSWGEGFTDAVAQVVIAARGWAAGCPQTVQRSSVVPAEPRARHEPRVGP